MRLTKGLKSSLCCLVIISVVMMVAGSARAESAIRAALKARGHGNVAAPKPAKGILSAVAAGTQGSTVPAAKGQIAAALANAANKAPAQPKRGTFFGAVGAALATAAANTAPALPKTKGTIANALANAANKAAALPKSTPKMNLKEGRRMGGIVGGVIGQTIKMPSASAVKAPRQPKLGIVGALVGATKAPRQPRLTGR